MKAALEVFELACLFADSQSRVAFDFAREVLKLEAAPKHPGKYWLPSSQHRAYIPSLSRAVDDLPNQILSLIRRLSLPVEWAVYRTRARPLPALASHFETLTTFRDGGPCLVPFSVQLSRATPSPSEMPSKDSTACFKTLNFLLHCST